MRLSAGLMALVVACGVGVAAYAADKTVAVNGTEIVYTEAGSGSAVVFVHGAISDHRIWERYREPVADERRFVAYTQRYFGTQAWPDEGDEFQILTHADDLIGFVEALDIAPVHLVTHSYSGMVGTFALLKRPDLFRSAIHFEPSVDPVIATLPGGDAAERELSSNFGKVGEALNMGQADEASLRFFEAVGKAEEGSAAMLVAPLPKMLRDNGRTIPLFISKKPAPAVSCNDLAALEMPTLIVQGSVTFARFSMIAEEVARCQANALIVTMDEASHVGTVEQPETFAEMIDSFLDLVE